jgi:hypothetical protein
MRLSALSTGRPFFWGRLRRPQGHSAAGMVKSIEISYDLIGNQNRDLQACSIVPQPTTLPPWPRRTGERRETSKFGNMALSRTNVVLLMPEYQEQQLDTARCPLNISSMRHKIASISTDVDITHLSCCAKCTMFTNEEHHSSFLWNRRPCRVKKNNQVHRLLQ